MAIILETQRKNKSLPFFSSNTFSFIKSIDNECDLTYFFSTRREITHAIHPYSFSAMAKFMAPNVAARPARSGRAKPADISPRPKSRSRDQI
jgi:hypothetical protein